MRIVHNISIRKELDKKGRLKTLLDKVGIKYVEKTMFLQFNYYEDSVLVDELNTLLGSIECVDIVDTEFSKQDCDSAEWLQIRSRWYWDYPQPEDGTNNFLNMSYDQKEYCDICGIGKHQKKPILVKGEPPWRGKKFVQLNWLHDELFINSEIVDAIKLNFSGVTYLPVLDAKTNLPLETAKQLIFSTILPDALVCDENVTVAVCDVSRNPAQRPCTRRKFLHNRKGLLKFKREAFIKQPDFVKSNEYFGDGGLATRLMIVSQHVREIVDKKRWKDVVFEPVLVVD